MTVCTDQRPTAGSEPSCKFIQNCLRKEIASITAGRSYDGFERMQNIVKLPHKEIPKPSASHSSNLQMVKSETPFAISSSRSLMRSVTRTGRREHLRSSRTAKILDVFYFTGSVEGSFGSEKERIGRSKPTYVMPEWLRSPLFPSYNVKGIIYRNPIGFSSNMASRRRLQFGV